MKKPIILTILDGYGLRNDEYGNAVIQADNRMFNYLWENYPHTTVEASGEFVGLPKGQMGNSEVGHSNLGTGRIALQPLEIINGSIENKEIFNNQQLLKAIEHAKKNKSKLHIMGLLSDGGVHSHINHLFAIIDMCKKNSVKNVYYHLFLDGRDTRPNEKEKYLKMLQEKINETNIGNISTISGRYYAMDRDNRWDRVEKAYQALIFGEGKKYNSVDDFINRNKDRNDEFVEPSIINQEGLIKEDDSIIIFNFRPDRLKELSTALVDNNFTNFKIEKFKNLKLTTMMLISNNLKNYAFEKENITNTLGEILANNNKKQMRIAETEKYAHVTYFFDGGKFLELKNCKKVLVPSPKVASYATTPAMSANIITDRLLEEIHEYDLIILNFANGDMVGHTGNLEAAIKAVEAVDYNVERIYKKIKELDGIMLITADHGNCEEMLDEKGNILTAHTTNLVPLIITKEGLNLAEGSLSDIAPTILSLMNITKPKEMSGKSLIK